MDIADTIAPNSEQVNAEDFLAGPQTVTVTAVEKGTQDQPVFIHLAEFEGRTYRPAKSMRRVLVACWGAEAAAYVGRRLELYLDPTVKWGGQEVGGIRISKLSHVDKPVTVSLTVTRGKRAPFTVQPLTDDSVDFLPAIEAAGTLAELQAVWKRIAAAGLSAAYLAAKDARKAELMGAGE